MALPPKLETYLSQLDRALQPIATSDRADIVTEIKSHVLDAIERDGEASLPKILEALGEPEAVANRYLLERGLKPGPPARTPMVKWLTLGFLGTLALSMIFAVVVLWKFSPVVTVDGENDRVSILGGLVDIDGKAGKVKIGGGMTVGGDIGGGDSRVIAGDRTLDAATKEITLPFRNANIEMEATKEKRLAWECRVRGKGEAGKLTEGGGKLKLDFSAVDADCELKVPAGPKVILSAANGDLRIERPQGEVEVKLDNGQVRLEPDPGRRYRYDLKVANGHAEGFESSDARDAIRVAVAVGNGSIEKE